MTKEKIIRTMVEESSSFTHLKFTGYETIGRYDYEKYVDLITGFLMRRLKGISILTYTETTGPQVLKKYRETGQGKISRNMSTPYTTSGSNLSVRDIMDFTLEREED